MFLCWARERKLANSWTRRQMVWGEYKWNDFEDQVRPAFYYRSSGIPEGFPTQPTNRAARSTGQLHDVSVLVENNARVDGWVLRGKEKHFHILFLTLPLTTRWPHIGLGPSHSCFFSQMLSSYLVWRIIQCLLASDSVHKRFLLVKICFNVWSTPWVWFIIPVYFAYIYRERCKWTTSIKILIPYDVILLNINHLTIHNQ